MMERVSMTTIHNLGFPISDLSIPQLIRIPVRELTEGEKFQKLRENEIKNDSVLDKIPKNSLGLIESSKIKKSNPDRLTSIHQKIARKNPLQIRKFYGKCVHSEDYLALCKIEKEINKNFNPQPIQITTERFRIKSISFVHGFTFDIGEFLTEFPKLEELDVVKCNSPVEYEILMYRRVFQIETLFFKTLSKIKTLKKLSLKKFDDSSFIRFPCLDTLDVLILKNNGLTSIPESIFRMKKLKHLDLRNNGLNFINPDFSNLQSLEFLDLSGNLLQYFPVPILHLKKLVNLTFNIKRKHLNQNNKNRQQKQQIKSQKLTPQSIISIPKFWKTRNGNKGNINEEENEKNCITCHSFEELNSLVKSATKINNKNDNIFGEEIMTIFLNFNEDFNFGRKYKRFEVEIGYKTYTIGVGNE